MAMDLTTRFPTWPVSKAVDPSYMTGHLVHDACGVVLALSDVIYPKHYPACMLHEFFTTVVLPTSSLKATMVDAKVLWMDIRSRQTCLSENKKHIVYLNMQ